MKYILCLLTFTTLLLSFTSSKNKKKTPFSVITYNVWNGFESESQRKNTFVAWARQQHADVIAFEELNNFTQDSFAALAATWGHPYAVILKEKGYPVGISSRYPITNVYRLITGMHHGCLYAEIKGISFFVVHFSPFSSARRLQEAGAVIRTLQEKERAGKPTIILGDFNSFTPYDSIFYTRTGIRDSMRLAQEKNKVLENLDKNNEIDYKVIRSFLDAGFYDGFSLFHKKFERGYPTKVYPAVPQSDNIKIDHILLSPEIKNACKKVEIIKDPVTDTLSDHYPVKAMLFI
jgi:exonuclease III